MILTCNNRSHLSKPDASSGGPISRSGTVPSVKAGSDMGRVEAAAETSEPAWRERAVSRSVNAARSRAEQRVAALPRRRVRADRREGQHRLHDPRGHRSLETVATRLLRVLRRQGRTGPRAVRGDRPRGGRRHPGDRRRTTPIRSAGSARSRSDSMSGATPKRRPANGARTTVAPSRSSRCISPSSIPTRVRAALAPLSRFFRELVEAADDAGAISVADPRRAAALIQQTLMYSWFSNRLVENPKRAAHRRGDLGVLPPRSRRLILGTVAQHAEAPRTQQEGARCEPSS